MNTFVEDLLEQAHHLATRDRLKTRQANLRRAVSAAYYGLFHFLIAEASIFVVNAKPESKDLRHLVGRSFEHGNMKNVCRAFTNRQAKAFLSDQWKHFHLDEIGAIPPPHVTTLSGIAQTFSDLQEERHRADYDVSHNFTRLEVVGLIERAEAAIANWRIVRTADPELARFFALSLLLWKQWDKR